MVKKEACLGGSPRWLSGVAVAGATYQYIREVRRGMHRTMCVHNLHVMARSLQVYAREHDRRFPDRFSLLYGEYITDLEMLVCPVVSDRCQRERGVRHPFSEDPTPEEIDSLCSYAIVPGLTLDDDPDTILAYEKEE